MLGCLDFFDEFLPVVQLRVPRPDIEQLNNFVIQTFLMKDKGNFINMIHIFGRYHLPNADVAEKRNFRLDVFGQEPVGAA